MNSLYDHATQLFYQIANAFFWPVAIALLVLFVVSLVDLGALFVEWWRRRGAATTDLGGIEVRLRASGGHEESLAGVRLSPALARFWTRVVARLREVQSSENIDVWLDETLQQEEMVISTRLDRSRAMVRLGPMLGLAGTIIPLGPALQALLTGDVAGMVGHLVIGFGAVVCGLMMSGIAYYITLVRERWARIELKEMENLCELVVRARRGRGGRVGDDEEVYAQLSPA